MPIPLLIELASAVGPMLAKKGLSILSGVFHGTVDKKTEEIADLIKKKTGIDVTDVVDDKLTDQQWLQLREFEHEYQEKLLDYQQSISEQQVELAKVHQVDRASARQMQAEALKSEGWLARNFVYLYALIITFLTFGFIFLIVFDVVNLHQKSERIVDTVLGFLLGVSLSAIIQFFFGSSQGSSKKQEQIDRLSQHAIKSSQQQANKGG